jgi:hypothetical protein
LLDLDKFPIKDSYVDFLREDRQAINRNPKTVKRLCEVLYQMGFEKMADGIIAPKEPNQRRGQQFGHWLQKSFALISIEAFKNRKKGDRGS